MAHETLGLNFRNVVAELPGFTSMVDPSLRFCSSSLHCHGIMDFELTACFLELQTGCQLFFLANVMNLHFVFGWKPGRLNWQISFYFSLASQVIWDRIEELLESNFV